MALDPHARITAAAALKENAASKRPTAVLVVNLTATPNPCVVLTQKMARPRVRSICAAATTAGAVLRQSIAMTLNLNTARRPASKDLALVPFMHHNHAQGLPHRQVVV